MICDTFIGFKTFVEVVNDALVAGDKLVFGNTLSFKMHETQVTSEKPEGHEQVRGLINLGISLPVKLIKSESVKVAKQIFIQNW